MSKKQTLEVKWIMLDENGNDDNLIRFIELENPINLSKEVAKLDFDKIGIKKGTKVSVQIEEQDENQVVTYMTVADEKELEKTDKKETKKESETTNDKKTKRTTKKVTVQGISSKGDIIFKEEENVWYSLECDETKDSLEKKGIVSGSSVEIEADCPEGSKPTVLKITKVEEKELNSYEKTSNAKGNSIEAQCAVKTAFEFIASRGIQFETIEGEKEYIKELADLAYDKIQELKSK